MSETYNNETLHNSTIKYNKLHYSVTKCSVGWEENTGNWTECVVKDAPQLGPEYYRQYKACKTDLW